MQGPRKCTGAHSKKNEDVSKKDEVKVVAEIMQILANHVVDLIKTS